MKQIIASKTVMAMTPHLKRIYSQSPEYIENMELRLKS